MYNSESKDEGTIRAESSTYFIISIARKNAPLKNYRKKRQPSLEFQSFSFISQSRMSTISNSLTKLLDYGVRG